MESRRKPEIFKKYHKQKELDVEREDEAVEVDVIITMLNNGSMVLTLWIIPPHSQQQICKQLELKGKRVYSGGKIRLDVAAEVAGEVAGEVVTTTGETITIEARTAMTI